MDIALEKKRNYKRLLNYQLMKKNWNISHFYNLKKMKIKKSKKLRNPLLLKKSK